MQEQFPELLTSEIENEKVLYPLEGYLFPATYDFYEEKPNLESIVVEMLKKPMKRFRHINRRWKKMIIPCTRC